MDRVGIDNQTVFGMPPIELITLAAELDCGHVTMGLEPVSWKLDRFPEWSLRNDAALRRETKAALHDTGIAFASGDGCVIRAGVDVLDYAADIDIMAGLGAKQIATVTLEPDRRRATDQLATLVEMATGRNLAVLLEFAPPHSINTLDLALRALAYIASPDLRLVIDSMHFFRSGGTVDELSAVDPALIGHVQICDAPITSSADYYAEASFNRLLPGTGALPLRELISVVPGSVRLGLELPMRDRLNSGDTLEILVRDAVFWVRQYLGGPVDEVCGPPTSLT